MAALRSLKPEQVNQLLESNARSRTPRRQWLSRTDGWQDSTVPMGAASGSFVGRATKSRRYILDTDSEVVAYKL